MVCAISLCIMKPFSAAFIAPLAISLNDIVPKCSNAVRNASGAAGMIALSIPSGTWHPNSLMKRSIFAAMGQRPTPLTVITFLVFGKRIMMGATPAKFTRSL